MGDGPSHDTIREAWDLHGGDDCPDCGLTPFDTCTSVYVGGCEGFRRIRDALHKREQETAELRRRKKLAVQCLAREMQHSFALECDGAFSLDRDPFHLIPAIDAYAAEVISGGKMRECIRRWLAGANFRDPDQREWERASDGT